MLFCTKPWNVGTKGPDPPLPLMSRFGFSRLDFAGVTLCAVGGIGVVLFTLFGTRREE